MSNKTIGAVLAAALAVSGCEDSKQKLYVYTWADYISPELITKFEVANNCKVVIDTFDCNESMYAKLLAGATGYDIIMPTEYVMPLLVNAGLVDKIDMSMLPNASKNFDHMFDSAWSMKYDVPYAFSCTGILWRKDKCPPDLEFKDWNDLLDARLNRRVCIMNDIRELLGVGLVMSKSSVNSTNEVDLAKAVDVARKLKAGCSKMDNEAYRTGIPSGEFYAAMSYNADAIQLITEGGENLEYIVPTNGTTSSVDVMCVMKGSKSKELAHKFIDMFYVLDNAVVNAEYNGVPMPVAGLFDALSDEYKAIPFMRVTDELKSRCEDIRDVSDKIDLYSKAWDKVKAK